jgi:hypothetical protein
VAVVIGLSPWMRITGAGLSSLYTATALVLEYVSSE